MAGLISKRLLHLTYDRAEGTKPTWRAFRIAWELRQAVEVFCENLKPERLSRELLEDATVFLRTMQVQVDEFGSIDGVESAPLSTLWEEDGFWLSPTQANTDST